MGGKSVLIVEDDQDMRHLIGALLEMEGYVVASLDHIEPYDELINQVNQRSPDLLLIDVHINGKTSFEFIEKFKEFEVSKRPKVLMSSGMAIEGECIRHGADGFLLKPYMPDELIRKINQMLESV
ncbi:MAG: response regulator [Anaerolineales bacterium]